MSIDVHTDRTSAETYEQYRALSSAAVASLIVGLLSSLAILDWTLVAVPVIGVCLSLFAWAKVKRHADELTGAGLAKTGLALSVAFAIAGPAWLTYVYVTELPAGYERISYSDLQPDPAQAGQLVPPAARSLEGKKIFIKGFVYPGRQLNGIREFLLVRDRGECCFGGNPKITDRIQVTLENPLRLTYAPRLHKVGGTFHVEVQPTTIDGAQGGVYYHLKADHLE
ncbi:MAG: hypothetical protein AB7O59_02550 [Pirellulales bacterium]